MRKSPNDASDYRSVTLDNGLSVLLISDSEASEACVALDVNVGHFSDPPELPGLAHFLEHMLFLGSSKYPVENSYKSYLSTHGGKSNASTGMQHTTFHFEVMPEHLEGAVDIFAQFFISPLMTDSATARELNAINEEYSKNVQNDARRVFQLMKSHSFPSYPFCKFGTGNLETLKETPEAAGCDVRAELLRFHEQYYSASIMKLAMISPDSVDNLERIARTSFSDVRNNNVRAPTFGQRAGLPFCDKVPQLFKIVPVKETRTLNLWFPVPPVRAHYKKKPLSYLAHLFGHEGPGSILSLLKSKGWATSLTSGKQYSTSDFDVFYVAIALTIEGLAEVPRVAEVVFAYSKMLEAAGPQARLFDELAEMHAVHFRFLEKKAPTAYLKALTRRAHTVCNEDLLHHPFQYEVFDPALLSRMLAMVTPSNVRVILIAKDFGSEADLRERWYQTSYCTSNVPPAWLEAWSSCDVPSSLHLPAPNEFIPKNLEIAPQDGRDPASAVPSLVCSEGSIEVWHAPCASFSVPKAAVHLLLATPRATESPLNAVLSALVARMVEEALKEFAYAASIAGLYMSVGVHDHGIEVKVRGYSESLPRLMSRVVAMLGCLHDNGNQFDVIKEKKRRVYLSASKHKPHEHAMASLVEKMVSSRWTPQEKLEALEGVAFADVAAFGASLFPSGVFLKALVGGNIPQAQAVDMVQRVWRVLKCSPLPREQYPSPRVTQLPRNRPVVWDLLCPNEQDETNAVVCHFQLGTRTLHLNMMAQLFAQISKEHIFSTLRTREQLGYVVWSYASTMQHICAFDVVVVSKAHGPRVLEARIQALFDRFEGWLGNITDDKFAKYVEGLVSKKIKKDRSLYSQCSRFWRQITSDMNLFDRDAEVQTLRSLTAPDVLTFFRTHIRCGIGGNEEPCSSERRQICVRVTAHSRTQEGGQPHDGPSVLARWLGSAGFSAATCNAVHLHDLDAADLAELPLSVLVDCGLSRSEVVAVQSAVLYSDVAAPRRPSSLPLEKVVMKLTWPRAEAYIPFVPPVAVHNTAVIVCPPRELWHSIQDIRQEHDPKHVDLWPPHVTLFYPFWPEELLDEIVVRLRKACSTVAPFTCQLAAFGSFNHGKRGFVTWLDPQPNDRITSLYATCATHFPGVTKGLRQPHLTVARGMQAQGTALQARWAPLSFDVSSVFVVARPHNKAPMKVIAEVPLGSNQLTE